MNSVQLVENLEVSINLWKTFKSTARSYKIKKRIEKKTEDSCSFRQKNNTGNKKNVFLNY